MPVPHHHPLLSTEGTVLKQGGVSGEAQRRPRISADAERCMWGAGARGARPQPRLKRGGEESEGRGTCGGQAVEQVVDSSLWRQS